MSVAAAAVLVAFSLTEQHAHTHNVRIKKNMTMKVHKVHDSDLGSYGKKFEQFQNQMDWLYTKWQKATKQGDTKTAQGLETVIKRLEPKLDRLRAQAKAEEKLELATATDGKEKAVLKAELASLDDTHSPTPAPSPSPTLSPTTSPTPLPTIAPTARPTNGDADTSTTSVPQPTAAPTAYVTYAPTPVPAFDEHRGICTVFGFKEGVYVPFLVGGDYMLAGRMFGEPYYKQMVTVMPSYTNGVPDNATYSSHSVFLSYRHYLKKWVITANSPRDEEVLMAFDPDLKHPVPYRGIVFGTWYSYDHAADCKANQKIKIQLKKVSYGCRNEITNGNCDRFRGGREKCEACVNGYTRRTLKFDPAYRHPCSNQMIYRWCYEDPKRRIAPWACQHRVPDAKLLCPSGSTAPPSHQPTAVPSAAPTKSPTVKVTEAAPTPQPTPMPPSKSPTAAPTTAAPTLAPTPLSHPIYWDAMKRMIARRQKLSPYQRKETDSEVLMELKEYERKWVSLHPNMWHRTKPSLIADSKSVIDKYGYKMLIKNTTLHFGTPHASWVLIRLENMELHSLFNMFRKDILSSKANGRPTLAPTILRKRPQTKPYEGPTPSPVPLHDDDEYKDTDDDK